MKIELTVETGLGWSIEVEGDEGEHAPESRVDTLIAALERLKAASALLPPVQTTRAASGRVDVVGGRWSETVPL